MPFPLLDTRIVLTAWQERRGVAGINAYIEANGLRPNIRVVTRARHPIDDDDFFENDEEFEEEVVTERVVVEGATERSANKKTRQEYRGMWQQLRCFAVLREDYQSAALLTREICPFNPLPILPSTLCEYLRYKYEKKGKVLCEHKTETPVRFRWGPGTDDWETLRCVGEWNAPKVLNKFRASVNYLHRLYPMLRGEYQEKCPDCLARNSGEGVTPHASQACLHHMGRPLLVASGCPVTSTDYKDEAFKGKVALGGHEVNGAMVLLPGDLRDLRNILVGSDLQGFQIYVMILLGIKLFLRSNELLQIKMEDFKDRLYIVNEDRVQGIAIGIKGKSDRTVQYLYIWADDQLI
jgi:hypothetical protein